jgi:hypothetical protein
MGAAGFATLDVSDAELRAAAPSSPDALLAASSAGEPVASWAALEKTFRARGYDHIEVLSTSTGALIVDVVNDTEDVSPRGLTLTLAKADAFPASAALDTLKTRLGEGRTLVIVALFG